MFAPTDLMLTSFFFCAMFIIIVLGISVKLAIKAIKFTIRLPRTVPRFVDKLNRSVEIEKERERLFKEWEDDHLALVSHYKKQYGVIPDSMKDSHNPYEKYSYYSQHPELKLF